MEVSAMWRCILLVGILIASPAMGWGNTVQFTVPQADIEILHTTEFELSSSGLNRTVLAGQNLSLDLLLSDSVLARLFVSDPKDWVIDLEFSTNAGTFPGDAGPTTGFLLGPNGNQFGDSQDAGRGQGTNGTFGMGLVSFTSDNLAGANVIDISGVHFDTTFPATGFVVTDAQLLFSFSGDTDGLKFGTAQQLPEPETLGLTFVGVLVIALAACRRDLKSLSALGQRAFLWK
ncbi:MAG: hypothetical protein E6K65_01865 [Nitrospirae bacterium]|nr:MAG: hypothetical protein E6K65_01865 [Nitrospirota bacterium]